MLPFGPEETGFATARSILPSPSRPPMAIERDRNAVADSVAGRNCPGFAGS